MQRFLFFILLLILTGCSFSGDDVADFDPAMSQSWYADSGEQCVPFARRRSGIQIRGDAHTWWYQCKPEKRHQTPVAGAVMVLSKSHRLSHGHLAVVKKVVNPREINVSHTNWGSTKKRRRVVYESMRVKDVSPHNDWSQAVFWNKYARAFGSPYKVSGFIHP